MMLKDPTVVVRLRDRREDDAETVAVVLRTFFVSWEMPVRSESRPRRWCLFSVSRWTRRLHPRTRQDRRWARLVSQSLLDPEVFVMRIDHDGLYLLNCLRHVRFFLPFSSHALYASRLLFQSILCNTF